MRYTGSIPRLVVASLLVLTLVGTPGVAADATAPTAGGQGQAAVVADAPVGGADVGTQEHCVWDPETGERRHCLR